MTTGTGVLDEIIAMIEEARTKNPDFALNEMLIKVAKMMDTRGVKVPGEFRHMQKLYEGFIEATDERAMEDPKTIRVACEMNMQLAILVVSAGIFDAAREKSAKYN